ncbi:hypothetical protein ccbrp13_56990 [Ktedonobacteria bacterium brp13]|nr:hypothetical protein ccbrp13_56990 [Ktedonobacteria bacterium brp13]
MYERAGLSSLAAVALSYTMPDLCRKPLRITQSTSTKFVIGVTKNEVTFTYEAVREWKTRFAPLLAEQLRTKRHGQAGQSWYVDETYVKVISNPITSDELLCSQF